MKMGKMDEESEKWVQWETFYLQEGKAKFQGVTVNEWLIVFVRVIVEMQLHDIA